MRIAHFLLGRCNPDTANGANQTVYHLSQAQAKLGHDVAIFSITPKPVIPITNVDVRTYPPSWKCTLPVGARLQDLWGNRSPLNLPAALLADLYEWRPDIVHMHLMHIPQNVVLAHHLRRAGIPYCVTPNGFMSKRSLKRHWLIKKTYGVLYEGRYLERAAFLHMVSRLDAEGLDVYRIKNRVVLAPNGIDLNTVPAQCDREALLRKFPQLKGRRVFVYLGRIDIEQKGLDLLVNAVNQLKHEGQIGLVIVGPDWRGNEIELKALIQKLDLHNNVFLTGGAYGQEKWDFLAGADVFVHPSRWEAGIPFSALEALAAGKPALLTEGADPYHLIEKYKAGHIVNALASDIASGMKRFVSLSADELRHMGDQARRLVQEELSWEPIAKTILAACEETCRRKTTAESSPSKQ